ncbi:hypothetical protein [Streptomyces litchfieldiae]|uniref:WXG100 family type VII secretion target n=1 Tax=Streptomyces litchfieldiae TaxID=3075543 RepID=A0ABU2MJI1_9ACTN|nr:hypothetical protein [Streptomyces sp. DSM 44938]MDT0341762.1 hypothetical protein [Streptomyces sp. DSM 44938]
MATRPADWYPLTEDGSDPVPGDWEMVQEAARRYRSTADAIQRAKDLLGEVTNTQDGWQSPAGEAFREKATELSDDIWNAWGRYDAAADALNGYWPALEEAQNESLTLRTQAQTVQDQLDSLGPRIDTAQQEADDAAAEEDNEDAADAANDQVTSLQSQMENAQAELNRLRGRIRQIVEDKDAAAQRAADAIGDFIGGDGLKDGFWDHVGAFFDGLRDFLIMIGEWAGRIAAICGVLALLVGWIPVIGQALAGILGTIALVAGIFSAIGNALQGKWLNFALDIIGIVTFGVGRALTSTVGRAGSLARMDAFRNVMRISTAGNRAARNAHAASIVGDGADLAARAGQTFTRPSGLLGWGREAFGGLGGEMVQNWRTITTNNWGSALGQGFSGIRNIGSTIGQSGFGSALQGGMHQFLGQADIASDALALGRAANAGADVGGLGAASGVVAGSAALGAASGNFGLFEVEGVDSLWNWPGLGDGENTLVSDPVPAGSY